MATQIGTGDDGKTSLFSGQRVLKSHPRIEIVGTLDELQSVMGIVMEQNLDGRSQEILKNIPHLLFDIGGEIAGEDKCTAQNITHSEVEKMGKWIVFFDSRLPQLHDFILSHGSEQAQWINFARSLARRLERMMQPLFSQNMIRSEVFSFVNRFSRLLFSLARWENYKKNGKEILWEKGKKLPMAPQ